ncbi:MAG TPA: hypothetical protein PKE45_17005 [Caldilineaceae bacterium]|nr:hypothetical protein [Caldilineaceae bacterium]
MRKTASRCDSDGSPHATHGSNEKRLEEEAIQAGAIGLLPKEVTGDQLARAIRAAYSGHPISAAQITALPS